MNVNYDYYRIFYYVAKCGNLSQAARELVNNQPNLTRSIKNLEAELGCTLFSRTNRGMKLTPEGERLYRHVKIAVEQLEAGEAELAQSRSLQAGTVFLAASEGALRCVPIEIGVISPDMTRTKALGAGEVGYIITGAKDVSQSKVGDTLTSAVRPAAEPLPGYRDPKPMVYAGLFPIDNAQFPELRDALDKLKLNDAALIYTPETSVALGFGFRCGFLGLLHMEIVNERLSREFGLDLIQTAPNVTYDVTAEDGSQHHVTNPSEFPDGKIKKIVEPMVAADIITPKEFIGAVMDLCQDHRGIMGTMEYISTDRVEMHYRIPLAEIVFDFFDQLKSRTKGYASLDYHEDGEQSADLVKVDILIQGEKVDAFSAIVHRDKAYSYGVMMTKKLRSLIPRQQFEIPIQAAIGSRIIARENIRALRKDVLAKCYGGDITRKRKLLEKQKAGKKRMKMLGHVEVPQEAFIAALSTGEDSNDRDTKDKIRAAQKTEG